MCVVAHCRMLGGLQVSGAFVWVFQVGGCMCGFGIGVGIGYMRGCELCGVCCVWFEFGSSNYFFQLYK